MEETTRDRLERGRRMMERVNPEAGWGMLDELGQLAPDFEELLLGFVFADIYDRDVLAPRERQLVRLGALAALGAGHAPLRANIGAALNFGLDRSEIVEAFLQALPYAGFPRVIDALHTVRVTFDEQQSEGEP